MNQQRHLGLDCLRLLSMMLIVLLHILSVGGVFKHVSEDDNKYDILWLMRILTAVGVNCFGLLSGYCAQLAHIKREDTISFPENIRKFRPIYRIWVTACFWSVGWYVLSWCWDVYPISGKDLVHGFLPVTFGGWWYFSSYFLLFFMMPYLDDAVKYREGWTLVVLIVLGVILIFLPSFSRNFIEATGVGKGGNNVIWLGYLYLLGAYLYQNKTIIRQVHWRWIIVGYCLGVCGSYLALKMMHGTDGGVRRILNSLVIDNTSIFVLISAICLLLLFSRWEGRRRHLMIEQGALVSFAVYIIHFHPRFQTLFYADKFNNVMNYPLWKCIAILLLGTIGIYLICAIMEIGRRVLWLAIRSLGKILSPQNTQKAQN